MTRPVVVGMVVAAGVAVAGCSSAPTQEESRAASIALSSPGGGGTTLGPCLEAAGYDVDPDTLAGSAERKDVTFSTGTQKAYTLTVTGPEDIDLVVLYDRATTLPDGPRAEAVLEKVGCAP
ncbi:hypothetical protein [Phycicoccus avicenniae]|uniref:hypothetical protein n=1 Tax=Phycicoccus avicenniae TaxID=2828860 RepID=UPI003D27D1DC